MDAEIWIAAVFGLAGALIAAGPLYLAQWREKNKDMAESTTSNMTATEQILANRFALFKADQLDTNARVDELEARLLRAEHQIRFWRRRFEVALQGISVLVAQLAREGRIPEWTPPQEWIGVDHDEGGPE